jgi:hypothetical protein
VFTLAVVLGMADTSQAQRHRHCWWHHHHRVCRYR